MTFEGKTAIVTGGARGIGLAIARQLAAGGATVVLVDVLADVLKEAAAGLAGAKEVLAYAVDVTDEAAVETMMDEVVEKTGRIDILLSLIHI